jgi:translation initiation factor IF-3
VRVIGADGSQVGILATHEAMRLAEEQGLELVEVNPRAAPPVCKIMDFGKFKYETSKKEKASRKHQSTILLKEIKLRPKTDDHDLDFKVKHIRRFLSEGNKCKLVTVFRGREIVHPETGQAMLDTVMKMVADIATVEQRAMMEGRRMVMVIGPKAGVFRPPAAPVPGPTAGPSGPTGTGPMASAPVAPGAAPAAPVAATPAAATAPAPARPAPATTPAPAPAGAKG